MFHPIRSDAHPSRRALYRIAKSALRKKLRKHWKGARTQLERTIRNVLRGRSRAFLRRVARAPACATLVAAAILATPALADRTVELADIASGSGGFVIVGDRAGDEFGASVSSAGDVNGDGLQDIIVGAYRATPDNRDEAGRAYVVFGKSDTDPVSTATIAQGSGGFVINGIAEYDLAGSSVSAAGDVNNDGLDDLIVGAPTADPDGQSGAGQSYVIFGKVDGAPVELSSISLDDESNAGDSGGFVINGVSMSNLSGHTVSRAGDVNGDGLDDLVIGAPRVAVYDGYFKTSAGQSYVVFGKADGAPVNLSNLATNDNGFMINGTNSFDESGFCVSAAGDHNNDGLDDLLIGVRYGNSGAGQAFVVFGKADTAPVDLAAIASHDATTPGDSGGYVIEGTNVPGVFGFSVSGAGDVNGDGIPDVIVGSPPTLLFYPNYATGDSYVIFGKTDGARVDAGEVAADDMETPGDSGGFAILGGNIHDFTGASVSGAGNFNADGLDDVVVGSYRADPNGQNFAGQTHVVFGKPDGAPVDLAALDGGLTINGATAGDFSGFSVSGAGDVNGDGIDDIIVGAPGAGDAGKAYLVFSSASPRIYLDFNFIGPEFGTELNPFNTLAEAIEAVPNRGTIAIVPGSTKTPATISKPVTLVNADISKGTVRIGGS